MGLNNLDIAVYLDPSYLTTAPISQWHVYIAHRCQTVALLIRNIVQKFPGRVPRSFRTRSYVRSSPLCVCIPSSVRDPPYLSDHSARVWTDS